jgi:hypothetical protein
MPKIAMAKIWPLWALGVKGPRQEVNAIKTCSLAKIENSHEVYFILRKINPKVVRRKDEVKWTISLWG